MILSSLSEFRDTAINYLAKHRDDITIDFLRNCYTIHVPDEDSPEGSWVSTLKFRDIHNLIFASCSCPDGECCVHLMIAYLSVYDTDSWLPLHYKFIKSFWHELFLKLFLSQSQVRSERDSRYLVSDHNIVLEISALSSDAYARWLSTIYVATHPETYTENTFPQSSLYRIAKYFFFCCKSGARLDFTENRQGFPTQFALQWEGISLKGEILNFETLESIFPTINFSQTTFLGNYQNFSVTQAHVSPKEATIHFTKTPIQECQSALPITQIGSVGYVAKSRYVLIPEEEVVIPISMLPFLHNELRTQLSSLLHYENEKHQIRYTIHLLRDCSLSFSAYLHTPGDLNNGELIYPDFCYLPDQGLFSITGLLSPQSSFTVKADQVEEFLHNKGDLIREPGFQVFTKHAPERRLTYNITQQGVLLFYYDNVGDSSAISIHYGPWVYHAGQGFFLNSESDAPIQDGLIVEPQDIPNFITHNEEFLRTLPNFFSPPPLTNLTLEIRRASNSGLQLTPIFEGLEKENCQLFGPFLYRENHGFHLLPAHLQPLSLFPKIIAAEQVPEFIAQNSHNERLIFASPELCPPETFELTLLSIKRPHPSSPLHLQLELTTNIGSISIGCVLQAIKNKKNFVFSQAGFLDFQHCLFQFLKQFIAQKCLIPENTIIATVTDIFKLDALAPMSPHKNIQASETDLTFFSQLKAACLPPIPQNLFSTDHHLRPYQNSGLLWLWFLYNHHLSGLLCDEMGLGKTHQAAALLDIVFQSTETSERPRFLVVCPTSVLPHWEHILATHLPTVGIFSFHGPNKPETIPPIDIIITSYGTLRQNYAKFYKLSFTIAVFDEIHVAKNKASQIHKILCRLNAQMKLGLTGTPVENNLLEFKSLLDIILPNYLPSDSLFKKLFTKNHNNTEIDDQIISSQDLLLKLTRPFILRRTKKLVLPELPEKVESIIPCVLSPEQKKLYLSTLKREKMHIQQLDSLEDRSVNYLHVFTLLNHLKQICDHPALFLKNPEEYKKHESGKWNAFVRLMHDSLSAGYKVVVFSQYIHMIRIITLYLDEIGVKYASIQGKSLNRKEEIAYFTSDPECRVFVGSLLAAGTGINLTAGNVVIMYDRWWNPAKENQALDRVHRIGQKNTVFIYKLMTEDTLEERIHYLIEKKVRLLDKVISTQDTNILHMLNKEDLLTILSYKDDHHSDNNIL
ncbi:DEAD/DEAH box helicase [Chlamydia avium]|uniref:Type III restriction enzyme, res subunit n=1 Tax=Chlamydia avium TaxID=1457141 RepID=A0ABN0MTK5_9CHLA|nr:DEAD/DEAH box helicase [Chlamydia avium]EPP36146.1 type III restriction enzyme, res subunit [Chlamydia psittaci 10_743_SC13]EPP38936.1 type III restriction enzyme, res subunit [Chlamydia avium]